MRNRVSKVKVVTRDRSSYNKADFGNKLDLVYTHPDFIHMTFRGERVSKPEGQSNKYFRVVGLKYHHFYCNYSGVPR